MKEHAGKSGGFPTGAKRKVKRCIAVTKEPFDTKVRQVKIVHVSLGASLSRADKAKEVSPNTPT